MNKLVEQLKRHEGFRANVYKCSAGKNTIGYGRNLDDKGVTHKEAVAMLITDIDDARIQVINKIDFAGKLNQARFDVLVNMAFNMGIFGLLDFKRMLAALDDGDYEKAAKEMLDSKWAGQVGDRAVELSLQMATGWYAQ